MFRRLPLAGLPFAAHHVSVASRAAAHAAAVCTQRRSCATDAASTTAALNAAAADAQRVALVAGVINRMKSMHTTGSPQNKQRLELQAWRDLQMLDDAAVENADVKSVTLLLNAWGYFAKYWEKGIDGPANPLPLEADDPADLVVVPRKLFRDNLDGAAAAAGGDGAVSDAAASAGAGGLLPPGARRALVRRSPLAKGAEVAQPPRHDPLSETIELD